MTMTMPDERRYGYYAPSEAVLRRFVELLRHEEAKHRPVHLARLWQEAGGAMAVRIGVQEQEEDDDDD